jgi:hypothetical protein
LKRVDYVAEWIHGGFYFVFGLGYWLVSTLANIGRSVVETLHLFRQTLKPWEGE